MKVTVKYIHSEEDKNIEEKLRGKLYRLGAMYDWIKDGSVFFKMDKNDRKKDKVVELLISTYGSEIYTEGKAETFELAAKKAMSGIKHQINKNKDKYFRHALSTPL